jgi:hypothetical protein
VTCWACDFTLREAVSHLVGVESSKVHRGQGPPSVSVRVLAGLPLSLKNYLV